MRRVLLLIAISLSVGCVPNHPTTPQQRYDRAIKEMKAATDELERFYALNDAAKSGFEIGKIEDAQKYAVEMLSLQPKFVDDWNYGNSVQDANLVLGRIAVLNGKMDDAKAYLLKAGESPGSPQMDTFGPNMSLAKDLLENGETDIVLEYFELCRKFWEMHNGKLDLWSKEVRDGKIPDFGPNLIY